jgi:type VI secretion system VgrG family protein
LFEALPLGEARVDVRSLDGTDELNQLFRFHIELVRPGVLSATDDVLPLLEAPGTLWFQEDGVMLGEVHGLVAEASLDVDVESDFTRIHLELVPRAWLLTQRRGDEIFLARSVPEVIAEKLQRIGLSPERDFVLSLIERYPVREFIAQHSETDWAFVSRLCEPLGITTFFEHHDGRDVLVFTDTQQTFRPTLRPTLPVRHRREHPAAYGVKTTLRRGPAQAEAHDYNYRAPLVTLHQQRPVGAPGGEGAWVEYGPHPKTVGETEAFARRRTEELGARRHVVEGTATELSVRAGGTITLTGLGNDQTLLLTRVVYRFRRPEAEGGSDAAWENQFTGIPAQTTFRPPRLTPWPRVPGLMNAVVDGAIKGDYAELDEAGRYHLRMGNDRSGRSDLGATHPVRMMQPHAGANYGMHFPLRPGIEVLVGFVNGDPDRPVIVGTAPNPVTSSPVEQRNQTQNVLRTGSNNEMVIEDEHGIERIRIHTPHRNTTVQLGSVEEAEEGALTTTEANLSEASRLSNNEATRRKALLADSSTSLLGRSAVIAAGLGAITAACERGIEQPASLSLRDLARDLDKISTPPEALAEKEAAADDAAKASADDASRGGLWSEIGEAATRGGEQAALDLVRAAGRTTDESLDRARGRAQGEPVGEPLEPSAIMASAKTAALVGRELALVFGDRVAALSSFDTASVVGTEAAQLKSPRLVEIAAGEALMVTTAGELGVEAKLIRMVGGYYPDAEAPPLDEGTSVGVMSRRDLRFVSVEDCILICAKKNLIGTAHTGDVRIKAQKTVSLTGGSIIGSAGTIKTKSSGDTEIAADGDITVSAGGNVAVEASGDVLIKGATVTIEGGTITLKGPVTVEGDLTVTGALHGG